MSGDELEPDHIQELLAAVRARVEACMEYGDASGAVDPAALDQAAELWLAAQLEPEPQAEIIYVLACLHWCRYLALPEGLDRDDHDAALQLFAMIGEIQPDLVPDEVARILGVTRPANQDPGSLYNRGVLLFNEFQQTGRRAEIDQAVTLFRQAAEAIPADHPRRGMVLSGLGAAYMTRFESFGDTADLDQAITWGRGAVHAIPAGHDDRPNALTNLGMSCLTRYQRFGNSADLDEAIRYCTEAEQQAGTSHPRRGIFLSNAGLAYRERFGLTTDEIDLAESIRYAEAALRATPADDVGFASNLANLAGAYQIRFTRFGDPADLSRAIGYWQRAERSSASHADHPTMLSALGLALRMRFEQTGDDADLDVAIRHSAQAVRESPETHTTYAGLLLNCAAAHKIRFDRFQDGADLDEAFRYAQRAVQVTPAGHPERAKHLGALAVIYQALFRQTGRLEHLDQAVRLGHEGLEATPLTHADRGMRLSDLGLMHRMRFEQTTAPDDLRQAIHHGREAVQATASGDPERAMRLSNLGLAYQVQYELTRAEKDLDRAIRWGTEAVEITPAGHPNRAGYLSNLAQAHRAQFERGTPGGLAQAISCWRDAVSSPVAPVHQRVAAATAWGIACENLEDAAPAAEGFAAAVRLLPLLAWRGLERSLREQHLADLGGLVTDAAGWAIEAGNLENAVELLEQGRSVLWSQPLQLRTDLARLRVVNAGLASRLDEVREALDRPRPVSGAIDGEDAQAGWDKELVAGRYRELARQWDDIVGQVRDLPGFESFLGGTPFSRLREASSGGPVVVVNISNRRCDALIVTAAGVRVCALPGLNAQECTRRANELLNTLYPPEAPAAAAAALQAKLIPVLFATMSWLWDTICGPVLKDLHDQGDLPGDRRAPDEAMPRLWWCPTGPLTVLPLHAAGHHEEADGGRLSQVAVSSYTPTVEALLRSRGRAQADTDTRVIAIGMPTTPRFGDLQFPDLPAAVRELDRLTEALPGVSVQTLRSPTRVELRNAAFGHGETQPTRERVMRALPSHSWVHFACHGGQDLMDPSRGAVYLADGPLTVLQLAAEELPAAELAFLSACQTAVGGVRLPDETIHLAAAVQFAGYRHVIATAWFISDDHAPEVARDTYTELAATGRLDASRAAAAIHRAVEALRERQPSRPDLWAPYLHIGP
jgi:tetratricopeptide (TPR) repeat protein